jgi:hypothetical protein
MKWNYSRIHADNGQYRLHKSYEIKVAINLTDSLRQHWILVTGKKRGQHIHSHMNIQCTALVQKVQGAVPLFCCYVWNLPAKHFPTSLPLLREPRSWPVQILHNQSSVLERPTRTRVLPCWVSSDRTFRLYIAHTSLWDTIKQRTRVITDLQTNTQKKMQITEQYKMWSCLSPRHEGTLKRT